MTEISKNKSIKNIVKNKLIKINTKEKDLLSRDITRIAGLLNDNKVIILPAKTMYGISARFDSKEASEKIYRIKERPAELPFIVLISEIKTLPSIVSNISMNAKKLIDFYWDTADVKPLTIIFKKAFGLKDFVSKDRNSIAVRRAEFSYVRAIIDKSAPIISTSATMSGSNKNPLEISQIPDKILKNVDMIIEHDNKLLGTQSTIIDISGDSDYPKLVRQGVVPFNDILQKLQIKI